LFSVGEATHATHGAFAVFLMRQTQQAELVIKAERRASEYWSELWRYRELFYFLAWRDVLVRYKQTVIGVAWALVKSLATLLVLTVIFGRLAGMSSAGVPYPLLVFAAVLPWQFFSSALTDSSNSLVAGAALISKIYFPRVIVPGSAVIVNLVDFSISCGMLAILLLWYGFLPDWKILTLPLFSMLAVALSIGIGLWFAALMVEYRYFRFIVPFALQLGLYASPVGFSSSAVPERWRLFYSFNPMVGVIDGFRWAILRGDALYYPGVLLSFVIAGLLLVSGLWYFRMTERTFADII
jgi:lipopolysaccharide transport system permease protein